MTNNPILIVDDEPLNLAALQQLLCHDYKLVFANGGRDAITAALKHLPALILLDINMPGIDGYSVCRTLKADQRTEAIPVIFVTSMSDVGDEAAGFAAGAVDYITKPFSPAIVKARVRIHLSLVRSTLLEKSHREAMYMLGAAGHYNDLDTGVHIWRMASYAGLLASAYGLSPDHCQQIELAAPMHDTGKLGIPHQILRKPAALDEKEWEIMKTHSQIGYNILSKSDAPIFKMAAEIALYHHEKYDGTGYPKGLSGSNIPISARIVALADVFDALTMKRPYKEAWPTTEVIESIQLGSGSHFEPKLVDLFLANISQVFDIKYKCDDQERTLM